MDTENLRIFMEVAQSGSFSTVARDRDVDPSSISRSIAHLEEDLGIRLFQRTTRRVALTESGELYYAKAAQVLEDIDQARDEARRISVEPAGILRLTASVAFGYTCLLPHLGKFREEYPEVKLELLFTDNILDLVTERVDLAIRLGRNVDSDFISTKLIDTPYRVCASPSYLENNQPLLVPDDLKKHSCLLFALPNFRSRWLFRDQERREQEVPVHGDITILNALALRYCAIAGMGPALLASWLIDKDIAEGRLVNLFPDFQVAATDFDAAAWLVYPSRSYLPSKVRVMIDFLKQHIYSCCT